MTRQRIAQLPPVRTACGVALLATLLPAGGARAQLRTERVADGVYAILQPATLRFDDSNSAVIVLDDGAFVIDTQNSPRSARLVLEAVRRITDKPVRWILNTHWHGDHVQGNEVYREAFPDALFIAQSTTATDIRERAMPAHEEDLANIPDWLQRARAALESGTADGRAMTQTEKDELRGRIQRREAYWENVQSITSFVIPSRLFDDTLTIQSGRRVQLMHLAGHTRGDVAVWIPDAKVLITGDLVDDLPFTGHGSPAALIETTSTLEKLQFDAMIPGHGAVRRGPEHMRHVRALFTDIVRQAAAAVRDGKSADEALRAADVDSHRDWFVNDDVSARYWNFFMADGFRRAFEEAGGKSGSL